jgi:RimJ/RimL family protein N-acetyltransferase
MIRGEKVVLRALEATDAERCHAWINDPEVTQFLHMRYPVSLMAEEKWVSQERDPLKELELAIEIAQGVHIGNCALRGAGAVDRSAELGIVIGEKQCWGRGYGTDAMLTLCAFGFNEMNLHRIHLSVYEFNPRAIACYEKCGFQHEARLRQAFFRKGAYHDILVMGILEDEFRAKWPGRCAP